MRRKETYPKKTTTRKKIYYPEGQIQKGLYTEGREWMLEDGTEYIGDYHKYITGEVFTKSSFIKNVSQLLIPFIDMSVKDLKQKFDYDTLVETPTSDFFSARYGITLPTQKDYDKGYFTRYFVKRHFDQIITEVTKDNFLELEKQHYVKLELAWKLRGNVEEINMKQVRTAERDIEGISNYLTNYSEFAKV